LYVPRAHGVQGRSFAPVTPDVQTQSPMDTLPSSDDEYAGHAVQAHEPVLSLYLPAAHLTHGPPPGPVYPTLNTQSTMRPLAAGAAVFDGHTSQNALPSGDHWPAGHARHVSFADAW
jgi:hypothetical protein